MNCSFLLCRVSERQIQIFKADSLSVPLNTVGLDVSPAILIPFYDEDSSTLFLTGKVCIKQSYSWPVIKVKLLSWLKRQKCTYLEFGLYTLLICRVFVR
jgi:hypothetical protein